MRKISLLLSLLILFFFSSSQTEALTSLGLGVCHAPMRTGLSRTGVTWFYWGGGGGQEWKEIEAVKGTYNFNIFNSELNTHFSSYPNTYFFLNIYTAQPPVVPVWAKPTRSDCPINDQTCNPYGYIETGSSYASFAPWNQNYQNALRGLINATANHIKNSSFAYKNKISAVHIMAGGFFGEMITYHTPGSDAYNKWLALGYTDNIYKDALVNKIIPVYKEAFSDLHYPFVIQLGYGLYGQESFVRSVIDAIYDTYPELRGRIYYKFDAWDQNAWAGSELINSQKSPHNILRDASSYTLVGWEPGAVPASNTNTALLFQNLIQSIDYTHASFFCLQDGYFNYLNNTQTLQIASRLEANITPYPTPITTLTPSPTLTRTPTPISCPVGSLGNLDCSSDGCIDTGDFALFRPVFGQSVSSLSIPPTHHTPDLVVDSSNLIDTADYEIFRNNFGRCN